MTTIATLHEAVTRGNVVATKELLDADISAVNATNDDGWTALHLAAHYGFRDVAELLLAAGADVNTRSANEMANTALHTAAAGQQAELAVLLLSHGADVNATQHGGFTALHSAAQNGQADLVTLLLTRGADATATTDDGHTARDLAQAGDYRAVLDMFDAQ